MLLLYTVLKAYSKFKLGKIASAAFDYELKSIWFLCILYDKLSIVGGPSI